MADRRRKDRELSVRIDRGDRAALEEAYGWYSAPVFRQALAVLGSSCDAEDVLQEVFLKLVRRKGQPIQDLKAYLLTAARHEAYSLLRRKRRERPGEEGEFDLLPMPESPQTSGNDWELREALLSLPLEQREVVVLKIYEQMTFEEIGKLLKTSINTAASRYRYAMKKLRETLEDPAHE